MTITQQDLKEWFQYHPDGFLIWKKSPKYDILIGSKAGSLANTGYIEVGFKGKRYLLHRLIFLYHYGYLPNVVDHKDRDTSNNKKDNLRPASKSLNGHNSDKISGIVPYRGVSFNPKHKSKPYYTYITLNRKRKFLGYYKTAEEASKVYQAEQLKLRKEVV